MGGAFEGIPVKMCIAEPVNLSPLHLASLAKWYQGSQTIYMVTGFP